MSMPSAHATEHPRRILVVDDEAAARADFVITLKDAGYQVAEAWSVVQAMRLLLSFKPDAVLLDLILPDGHGVDVGHAMQAIVTTRDICVVPVTGKGGSLPLIDPASFGARRVLLKPVPAGALLDAVAECFDPAGDHATPPTRPAADSPVLL